VVEGSVTSRKRLLDPIDRVSEILFGLIMALTFTGTLDAVNAGREDVRMLLVGTIGCNIAWGLVDAVMFLVATLTERGRNLVTVRAVRGAATPEAAHAVIGDALPPVVASLMTPADIERLRVGVIGLQTLPTRPWLERDDWMKAVGVFLLVFLSTFPVVIPFMFIGEVGTALRASNLVAIVMLFASGYVLARYGGHRPLLMGGSMVLLGVTLVGLAIALGG
jgi:VIT1/CCC1 family predicted Fe2+/Mn2+ transporter